MEVAGNMSDVAEQIRKVENARCEKMGDFVGTFDTSLHENEPTAENRGSEPLLLPDAHDDVGVPRLVFERHEEDARCGRRTLSIENEPGDRHMGSVRSSRQRRRRHRSTLREDVPKKDEEMRVERKTDREVILDDGLHPIRSPYGVG